MSAQRLHQLLVFSAIVEHGSITAAARHLSLSKGVVSTHLRQLEETLGIQLLQRSTRRMSLTEVGSDVHAATAQIRAAVQNIEALVEAETGTAKGRLRVATTVDLAEVLVRPVVRTIRAAHPEISLELLVDDEPVDLIQERVDIALRVGLPADSALIYRPLIDAPEILLAAPKLAEEWSRVGTPGALSSAPWILHAQIDINTQDFVEPSTGARDRVTVAHPVVKSSSTRQMRSFALDGLGVCMMPSIFVRDELASGRLVQLLPNWRRRLTKVYALTPSKARPQRARVFLDAVEVEAKSP